MHKNEQKLHDVPNILDEIIGKTIGVTRDFESI